MLNDGHFRAPYTLHRGDRCAIAETGAPGELRFQDRVALKDGSGVLIRGHQNAEGQTVWIKPVQGGPNLRLAVRTDHEGQARLLVSPRNGETEPTLSFRLGRAGECGVTRTLGENIERVSYRQLDRSYELTLSDERGIIARMRSHEGA